MSQVESENDINYQQRLHTLPDGWSWTPLSQICDAINGRAFKSTEWRDSGVPIIRIQNLKDPDASFNYFQGELDEKVKVRAGDLLFAWSGTPGTSFGAHIWRGQEAALNQHIFNVKFDRTQIDAKYFCYALNQNVSRYVAQAQGGVGLAHITKSKFMASKVPIAPLDQQKRIVAEIEKQFSRLDEAVTNLKRVKANLKRYKAAVLKAAVEGRLVETEAELARKEGRSLPTPRPGVFYVYAIRCDDDSIYIGHTDDLARRWGEHLAGQAADWTKQHKPIQIVHYEECPSRQEAADREKWLKTGYGRKWIKREIEAGRARQVGYETGAQLLQRILETRPSQWLASAEQAGRKGRGKYREPAAPDTTDLPELPEGWVWASLGSLLREPLRNGHSAKATDNPNGLRAFTLSAVTVGDFSEANTKHTVADREKVADLWAQPGDIYIERSNTPELVGTTRLYRGPANFAFIPDLLIRVRLCEHVLPEFVEITLMSDSGRSYFKSRAQGISGSMPKIDQSVIERFMVPLPPLMEQQRIVAEVDRRLSVIHETETQVDANLRRVERMRLALLSDLFAGKGVVHGRKKLA